MQRRKCFVVSTGLLLLLNLAPCTEMPVLIISCTITKKVTKEYNNDNNNYNDNEMIITTTEIFSIIKMSLQ